MAPRHRPQTAVASDTPGRREHRIRWLATAWALIGMGNALPFGGFSWPSLALVVVGSVVLVTVVLKPTPPSMTHWVFSLVVGTTALFVPFYPLHRGGPGFLSVIIVACTIAGLAILVTGIVTDQGGDRHPWRFVDIAALASAAGIATIYASPSPHNDVWFMYQAATSALLHGHNFYLTHWTSGLTGEVSNQFTYLPLSVVVLAPFHVLFGDVRVGLVAATVFAAWCAYSLGGPRRGWLCAALVLLFPKATFGIAMSWNDPLLLAGIGGMALAMRRHRPVWAMVALIVVLSSKQYAWLFLPLAAMWKDFGWKRALVSAAAALGACIPWALTGARAFWNGAVLYNLELPPRFDSLSLYSAELHRGVVPGYFLIAGLTLVGLAATVILLPRDGYGFLAGCAGVMAVFNLANKQTFFNQWELVGGLVILAMAAAVAEADTGSPPTTESDRPAVALTPDTAVGRSLQDLGRPANRRSGQAKARASRSSCSSWFSAALPVAGLADSARLTWIRVKRSRSSMCSRPWAKDHAPMFSGSSWSHTTSLADG